jgi:hypothetical protein
MGRRHYLTPSVLGKRIIFSAIPFFQKNDLQATSIQ